MNPGIDLVAGNLGFAFETIMSFLVLFVGIIAYAKDFKVGVITHLTLFAGLFVWFYQAGLNYKIPIIMFFIMVVILSLSLSFVIKSSPQGSTGGLI